MGEGGAETVRLQVHRRTIVTFGQEARRTVHRAAVVVALFNGATTIELQLDALAAQVLGDIEVIVADNGSHDEGPQIARRHSLQPRVLDASDRAGQAHARNTGAWAASAENVLFCDQDDIVHPRWALSLCESLEEYDLVGGRSDGETLNGPVREWRSAPVTAGGGKPLPWASGSNFGIRREVLLAIGGWPEEYRGGGEDTALCWRAQLAGYTLGYAPDAVVYYRYRTRLQEHCRQQFLYGRQFALVRLRFRQLEHGEVTPLWWTAAWLLRNLPLLGYRRTSGRWLGVLAYAMGFRVGTIVGRRQGGARWRENRLVRDAAIRAVERSPSERPSYWRDCGREL